MVYNLQFCIIKKKSFFFTLQTLPMSITKQVIHFKDKINELYEVKVILTILPTRSILGFVLSTGYLDFRYVHQQISEFWSELQ